MKVISILLLLSAFTFLGCLTRGDIGVEPEQSIETISTEEAAELIENNQNNTDFIILDIRTPAEFNSGRLENAINIDFYSSTFRQDLDELDKNAVYLVYCRSGSRSGQSLRAFSDLEFTHVYEMAGGITKWIAEDRPVVM